MMKYLLTAYRLILLSVAFCLVSLSDVVAADVVPVYRTGIATLVPPGGISQNPNLDTNLQPSTQEKALIDKPPELAAFVYTPNGVPPKAGWPAVVMMGGHTGIYTSTAGAGNVGQAASLSNRSKMWAKFLSDKGYIVYLMDDFTSYGTKFIRGFPSTSYDKRPGWASAAYARPYYAYSGLNDLARNFPKVDKSRIYLMGWSNGGTTVLSAASSNTIAPIPASMKLATSPRFKSILALYPACGLEGKYTGTNLYNTTRKIFMLNASKDTEVDTPTCTTTLYNGVKSRGGTLAYKIMIGAEHTYDGNNQDANRLPANVKARDYSLKFALQWFN